jgi:ATP-dependent RNA helicase RhlE
MTTVFGGVKQNPQVRDLARGVHLCVATPGRLLDLFQQGHLDFDEVETFILDEADRMLDMGFLPDLKRILRELPEQRHSLFFSATLPPPVRALAGQLLQDHVEVMVTPSATTVEQIEQRVLRVEAEHKLDLLVALLGSEATGQVLIFTKTRRGADRLLRQLPKHYADQAQAGRLRCAAIHSGKTQPARQRVLEAFKRGKVDLLIATDVAARGIDVEGLSHVVNFDVPHEPESYVHRIGRTGRAGASGVAVSFCTPEEQRTWEAIETLIGQRVPLDTTHPFHTDRQASNRGQGGGAGKGRSGRSGKAHSGGKSRGKTRGKTPNQAANRGRGSSGRSA